MDKSKKIIKDKGQTPKSDDGFYDISNDAEPEDIKETPPQTKKEKKIKKLIKHISQAS